MVTIIAGDIPCLLSCIRFEFPSVLLLSLVEKYGESYERKKSSLFYIWCYYLKYESWRELAFAYNHKGCFDNAFFSIESSHDCVNI